MEISQTLIEAAEPLVMFLRKTCNPHVKVIVDQTGAEVVEGILSTGAAFDGSEPEQIEFKRGSNEAAEYIKNNAPYLK
jgi:hypothetical protein